MSVLNIKLVVVGDGAVGKTSLLKMFKDKEFPTAYVPTVFENYGVEQVVDGKDVFLAIWDTAGQEEYDKIRTLSYPNTDVFLLCFAVTSPDSFENLKAKWVPELQSFNPTSKVLLVGLKSDLRDDPEESSALARYGKKAVTVKQAEALAKSIKAFTYMECSALTGNNVQQVFEEAIRSTMSTKTLRSKPRCTLL